MPDKNIATSPLSNLDGAAIGFTPAGQLTHFETKRWSRQRIAVKIITSTAYTLTADDEGFFIVQENGSPGIITVPTDAVMPNFPIGGKAYVMRNGSGTLRVNPAATVTLKTAGQPKLRSNGSVACLMKIAANTWVLWGDTAA
jgi:hypothetical protein